MMYSIRYPLGLIKKRIVEYWRLRNLESVYQNLPNNSIARLRELKGKYNGERCFIVGNGPSLRKMDLSLLKNEFGIVFNGAFELREYFAPDKLFHAVEDRLVLEDHQSAINELTGNVFLPSDLQHLVMSGNPIVTEFHRGFPESSENWPPVLDTSSDLPVFFWGGTVAYYGLQLAMWLGFEEVYFIGMDLSYSIPDSVKRKGNVLESTEDDPNHYKSSYFGAGLRWHVPRPERMLVAFEKAAQRNLSVRIYNAGVGGNLNCFTRVSYESLF